VSPTSRYRTGRTKGKVEALTPWDPAPLLEVARAFANFQAPWWIAGGQAIELASGHAIRDHGDIDVMVLRPDQLDMQQALSGWELFAADPPGTLQRWQPGEILPAHVHDVWCRPDSRSPWRIQVMLEEVSDGQWVFRRNPAIRRNIATLGAVGPSGIAYVVPEVQLLYKAKEIRPKDEIDFSAVFPTLTSVQREWLASAIHASYGDRHPWPSRLRT
jgi:hypothetical protein